MHRRRTIIASSKTIQTTKILLTHNHYTRPPNRRNTADTQLLRKSHALLIWTGPITVTLPTKDSKTAHIMQLVNRYRLHSLQKAGTNWDREVTQVALKRSTHGRNCFCSDFSLNISLLLWMCYPVPAVCVLSVLLWLSDLQAKTNGAVLHGKSSP